MFVITMKKLFLILIILNLNTYTLIAKDKKIQKGHWRTELLLNDNDTLPFTFYYYNDIEKLVIINASEKIELENIKISGNIISVKFPIFNSEFIGTIKSKKLIEGFWHNYSKGLDYKIPFISTFGVFNRFLTTQSNSESFTGKWEVNFNYSDSNNIEKAIGLFEEQKGVIHGTFLTETGDYRFLGGTSYGSTLKMSCFDGSHAFLFKSVLKNDTLWGSFLSGNHYKTNWYAVKNENFELRDPEKLTYVVNDSPLEFKFKDINNNDYVYPNKSTDNKVVLIQILGTWCPNCMDETNFLTSIYRKYKENIEIIGVGFETGKTDLEKLKTLTKYKTHMGVDYSLLLGGDACKPCAVEKFPMLNNIMSFPTLLIIDKKGEIRKIHTGFSGPSTGKYYTEFVEHTTQFIEELIEE
jgi:thiol-disulfide isomerase/thioredoxin